MIEKTALRVLANRGYGYMSNPGAAGHNILCNFLGKEQVSRTLLIAGSKADLEDFNLIARNEFACTMAHGQNPNATVLWFRNRHSKQDITGLTGQVVLDEAMKIFHEMERGMLPEDWEAFRNLNQRAVNHYPPTPEGNMARVAQQAAQAQAIPSYSATRIMVLKPNLRNRPDHFIQAFIRESNLRTRNRRRGTQGALIKEFQEASPGGKTTQFNQETGELRTWQEWLESSTTGSSTTSPKDREKRPRRTREQAQRARESRLELGERIDRFISGENGAVLDFLIKDSISIESVPGTSVSLRSRKQDGPHLTLERLESGAIALHTQDYWTKGLTLPNPRGNREKEDGNEGRQRADGSSPVSQWSTRGMVLETAQRAGLRLIRERWEQDELQQGPPPRDRQIIAGLNRFWKNSPEENRPWAIDARLSERLQNEITQLLDRHTWDRAQSTGKEVTLGPLQPRGGRQRNRAGAGANQPGGDGMGLRPRAPHPGDPPPRADNNRREIQPPGARGKPQALEVHIPGPNGGHEGNNPERPPGQGRDSSERNGTHERRSQPENHKHPPLQTQH